MSKLVKLSEYFNRTDADLLKSLLESEGIPAYTQADDVGGMRPDLLVIGRVRVLVPEEEISKALTLLEEYQQDLAQRESAFRQQADDDVDDLPRENANVRRAYFSAVYGLFIVPGIAQLYALFLLFDASKSYSEFSKRDRRRFWITITFIVVTFACLYYFISKLR